MFEQDYMMRQIREWVRVTLKLLYHIDTEDPTKELLESEQQRTTFSRMIGSVDDGEIDRAEDELFAYLEKDDEDHLKMALLFYNYLNGKSDSFLEAHNFSREEVKEGLRDVLSRYRLEQFAEIFLN